MNTHQAIAANVFHYSTPDRIVELIGQVAERESVEIAVRYLQGQGLITPEVTNSGEQIDLSPINEIYLNVAQTCNMSCTYCVSGYANGGQYDGSADLMDQTIAKRAIDFLVQASQNSDTLVINFFGGEPLINFALIK